MLNIRHNPGLIILGILHILILAIPMSFAIVQKFEEIELFVMTEDMPAPIKQMVQREKKIPEVRKETPQEQKPVEEPQRVRDMVKAFMVIANTTSVNPSMLAGGIWEALITTAERLLVAIPILI